MLNIFDLRLTTATHLHNLKQERDQLTDAQLKTEAALAYVTRERDEVRKQAQSAENRLTASQQREADLAAAIKELEAKLQGQVSLNVTAQNGRIMHNEALYAVGKAWMKFKTAWQFRKDNPNMNPRDRKKNNEDMADAIFAVDATLPKRIDDPNVADPIAPASKSAKK